MLFESMHEFPSLAGSAKLAGLFCFVYMYLQHCQQYERRHSAESTDHRCIKLVHVLPFLIGMLHDVDLVVFEGSLVPDIRQDFFRI